MTADPRDDAITYTDVLDQHTKATVAQLRAMAHQYDGQPQGTASHALATSFLENVAPEVLASTLAAVLLDQARTETVKAAVDPAPDLAGCEIRVIGPIAAATGVLARLHAIGVPAVGERGPYPGRDRPGTVRIYTYTDDQTSRDVRRRQRGGHHTRGHRDDQP